MNLMPENLVTLVGRATRFLEKLTGPPLEELGGLLQDHVRHWRFRNQVRILINAEEFLAARGIEPRRVSVKVLVPLLETSSLEEESSMQDRWASLLASAADPSTDQHLHVGFLELLKQLSPFEASLLDALYDEYMASKPDEREALMFDRKSLCRRYGMAVERFAILVDNLMRPNLLRPPASYGGVTIGKYPIVVRTYEFVQMTPLAIHFIQSCRIGRSA